MRWEQQRGLPIHRVPGGQRHAVFAFRHELDEWLACGSLDDDHPIEIHEPPLEASVSTHQTPQISRPQPTELAAVPRTTPQAARFWHWTNHRKVIWVAVCILLLAILGYTIRSLAFPPRIEFTGVVQLTNDGAMKEGLVTDGNTVYFGEHQNSRIVLASVSAEGGPVRTISTPFVQAVPADVSPDGKRLLILAWEGPQTERTLWIVPVSGGQPQRVGGFRCHAAAWAPDGRRIAIAAQNSILMTADAGASIQEIQSFDTTPEYLRWSPDGRRLRFDLRDQRNWTTSFWELTFNDQDETQVSSLVPLNLVLRNCWARSMTLDSRGSSFVAEGKCGDERIYLLEKHQELWNNHFDLQASNAPVHQPMDLALDSGSKKLFVLGDSIVPQSGGEAERLDLFRFDIHSGEIRPFLPGVPATYVDFSRDGRSFAYIRVPDPTLWVSRSDGTAAREIELSANHLELPRWSPDGRWLAFTAQLPGKPWRIFVVSSDGGKPREASMGTASQGAPTWSPDGRWLVYGDVECQEAGTCSIHRLDLSTGREFNVPGSDGLRTARWSPDGHFIAALNPTSHEVLLFDLVAQRWQKLADGVNGDDLSWSADSRYLYASRPAGNQPEILRVSVKDAAVETVVDLRSFTALTGHIDTWFSLAPDGSIVFMREISSNEVYSLAW
jgi:Tol biopolymer transport system component